MAVETTVKAAAMEAAVAEARTTVNQKMAGIAAEMAVKAAAMVAAMAEAKTAAEGTAVMSRQQLWQQQGLATTEADNNQPKSGRNGS